MRTFQIVIAPLHVVQLDCDEMIQTGNILEFYKGDKVVATFQSYMGWLEVFREPVADGDKAKMLRLVPLGGEPAVTLPEPIDTPDPAA